MDSLLNGQSLVTVTIVIIIVTLLKIIEFLIEKISSEKSKLTRVEQEQLKEIHSLVSARDNDGMPLFYIPRSWADLQRIMLDKMEKITHSQERTTYVMETIIKSLESLSKTGGR